MQSIKMILLYPNIIQVWSGDVKLYEGSDWKAAQLSTVPF